MIISPWVAPRPEMPRVYALMSVSDWREVADLYVLSIGRARLVAGRVISGGIKASSTDE